MNTYYPESYKCSCGIVSKHYVWSADVKKKKHKCKCKKTLTDKNIEKKIEVVSIRTPTKNR